MKKRNLLLILLFTFLFILNSYNNVWCDTVSFISPSDEDEAWVRADSEINIDFRFTGLCLFANNGEENEFRLSIEGDIVERWNCLDTSDRNEYFWTVPSSGSFTLLIWGHWWTYGMGFHNYDEDTLIIHVDNDQPSINLDFPHHNQLFNYRPINIKATGRDSSSGVDKIEIWINGSRRTTINPGGTPHSYTGEYRWSPSTGEYRIKAKVFDNVGITDETQEIAVKVDINDPWVNIDSPPDLSWHKGGSLIPITVSGGDTGTGVSGIELFVENTRVLYRTTAGTYRYDWRAPNISGTYELRAEISDHAGNDAEHISYVYIDSDPPVLTGPLVVTGSIDGFSTTTSLEWAWPAAYDSWSGIKEYQVFIRVFPEKDIFILMLP